MASPLAISVESKGLDALLTELRGLMNESPDWLRWLASEALQGFDESVELLAIDGGHLSAAGASDLRVAAKPTDKLVLLVAALRAGNGKGGALVDFHVEHGGPHE